VHQLLRTWICVLIPDLNDISVRVNNWFNATIFVRLRGVHLLPDIDSLLPGSRSLGRDDSSEWQPLAAPFAVIAGLDPAIHQSS
jgi:hypothetical protein